MNQLFFLLLLIMTINCLELEEKDVQMKHFNNYTVIRIVPESYQQLLYIQSLTSNTPTGLDFWTEPSKINKPVDIMVAPEAIDQFISNCNNQSLKRETLIKNVESLLQKEKKKINESQSDSLVYRTRDQYEQKSFFENYKNLNQIYYYLQYLQKSNPDIVSIETIGKTSEGRDMKVIKIETKLSNRTKPIIFIDAGIHAREWIAVSTVMYIANQLVNGYYSDSNTKKLLQDFNWHILPVANPDGYEYSHNRDRMWRKTRSTTNSIWGCKGVDLNRNFGFHWNEIGASDNPCSEIYAGPVPFSEPESRAIKKYILANSDRMVIYLAIHSYSQVWLTPWGWTSNLPPNYSDLENKARIAVKALSKVHGTKYQIGTSTNVLYAAAGGADDWAFGEAKIKYVYTIELRDSGRYGFLLPKDQIEPTGQETWMGIQALAQEVIKTLNNQNVVT